VSQIVLSAVVIAQNSAATIKRCLESLVFADEIVVVDALSHDGTPDIARGLGAKVFTNPWPGFAAQKQFAIDQAAGHWVFLCDTDEEVSADLAAEIRETIGRPSATTGPERAVGGAVEDGYEVRRKNQFLGEWITVGPWAHDTTLRLFRKSRGRMTQSSVHEGVQVDGTTGVLEHPLYHCTHPTISGSIERLNRYTTLEAGDRVNRRKITLLDPVFPPAGVFINYYFVKGCWRAGLRGFLLSAITAMYKSVLYIKIYLLQHSTHKCP
jgi:glycosyltransferase involved in cell wall biosynthesis